MPTIVIAALLLAADLRVAPFRADATPDMGEPLIWVTPVTKVLDPLYAKGVVVESKGKRYVMCAMDWCGVSGRTHRMLREALAKGAKTKLEYVTLHTVHQHSAPYIDGDGYALMSKLLPKPPLMMSDTYLGKLANNLTQAASAATFSDIDQIGLGEARVDRVASARRIKVDGKLVIRFSTAGKDPAMAALPEEPIDPMLRTLTFASKGKPVARLHYYATHPQTFCCDGRVSGDMLNAAREEFEKQDCGALQINFDGAGGNVTVGKYNDGSDQARNALAERLRNGMSASAASTKWLPAGEVTWRTEGVRLPHRPDLAVQQDILKNPDKRTAIELYRAAIAVSFANRKDPVLLTSMQIGKDVRILHMPGEPLLEFQNFAREQAANVLVAGYGDLQTGYLCPDISYQEGGYEPSASNAGPGTEAILKTAIQKLLRVR
jgi:hypothetical protein